MSHRFLTYNKGMKQGSLSSVFPPPSYLSMPSIGLDISDRSIHGIGLEWSGSGMEVAQSFERKIPQGVVVNGKVEQHLGLVSEIRAMKEEFGFKFVHVSLPERHGYVFPLTLPAMKHKDIRNSIESKLEENVPIPANTSVFDYTIEGSEEWDGASKLKLGVSVYPRSIVEGYIDAFEEAGCIPLRFEIEVYAIARAAVPFDAEGVTMVADIGFDSTTVIIVSEGVVRYSSTISMGGDSFVKVLIDSEKLEYDDAEALIHKFGLNVEIDGKKSSEVAAVGEKLVGEVVKQFNYWNSHNALKTGDTVDRVLLCGGTSNTKGLLDLLDAYIDVGVGFADVFTNVSSVETVIPQIPFQKSLSHAASIGLALDI